MSIELTSGTRIYQWDTGHTVSCGTDECHMFKAGDTTRYQIEVEDGVADVPDELLQTRGKLVCMEVEDGKVVSKETFTVQAAPKPEGYTYTATEAKTVTELCEELQTTADEASSTATAASETATAASETASAAAADAASAVETAEIALGADSGYFDDTVSGFVHLGRDLSEAFADEIGSDEPIEWLQARAQAADFDGLAIGDYLSVTLSNTAGTTMKYQIAAFDHYYGCGDTANGHHITLVPATLYPTAQVWNSEADNNGTSDEPSPWLASDLCAWMNSDFLGYLPDEWQSALVDLRVVLPTRYSSSGTLTDDAGYEWASLGSVWAPSEREVWGDVRRGTMSTSIPSTDRRLPIFERMTPVRCTSGTSRYGWWERCAISGSSTNACHVRHCGTATANTTTYTSIYALPCFRVCGQPE